MALNRSAVIQKAVDAVDLANREVYLAPFRKSTPLPVIRVDILQLRFNANLGRLILHRLSGAHLEPPDDPKAQAEIQRLILEQREAKDLRGHLEDEGQLQPGIVSADGTLINGNRRLAVLRDLWEDTKDERYKYMRVAVLPKDATAQEMYLLEVNLQMTPETRAKYGPITALAQLRFGLDKFKLDKRQLAHAMYIEPSDLEERLAILQLVDEYLGFIKRPGAYGLLEKGGDEEADHQGKYEHFITLNRLREVHAGKPYWEAFQRHVFQLIRGGQTFQELRQLKKWTPAHFARFAEKIGGKPATSASAKAAKPTKRAPATKAGDSDVSALAASISAVAESVSPEAAAAAAAMPVPAGPSKPEKGGEGDPDKDPALRATFDAVAEVNEQVQSERASKRPSDLLRGALAKMDAYLALQVRAAPKDPDAIRKLVAGIEAATQKIKKTLAKRA